MRYWEFLIQQEGDQTWLPLETRQVEILEGRYRMAAHTSYDSTSVEVRVSQLLLDEIPPRRRVRKRKTNTSDSGLLAIFPFIQLSPGRWEIDCNSPDVIDDFLGEGGWHYSVQLQVTPRDDEDWEPDWSEAAAEQSLDDVVSGPLMPDVDSSETDAPAEFQLQLKQQAYVTQLGQSLTLSGTFSASRLLSQGQLWVQLRDPQTASTIREIAFDVPNESLFAPFSVAVTLPDELSTQVILGALSLIERGKSKRVLASASFTVTMGLAQMLDAIATQPGLEFEEEISIFPGSTESFIPSPEKSEALLSNETPIVPKELIPSEGLTLPPQIKPVGDIELERPPELPTFPAETGSFRANVPEQPDDEPAASTQLETLEDIGDSDLTNADQDSIDADELDVDDPQENDVPFANPKVFEIGSIEDDDLDLELATAALENEPTEEPITPRNDGLSTRFAQQKKSVVSKRESAATNIDRAFQRLQLRERFWQKLSLFTQDGYRHSLEVQQALHASEDRLEGNPQSNEFVDYEPSPQRYSSYESKQPPQESSDEPIQVLPPMLSIPEQELTAGEWIAIKVRVPTTSYQPYVKVWMNDLQTRTMIDAPRLLMQFIPNENNELETLMRVRVPTGCLELQFAAISVDMATLQESRKVIQNRRVMPPDDSLAIFDDWDV